MKSKLNKFFAWIIVLLLVLGLAGFGLQDVISRWGTTRIASVGDTQISTEDFKRSFIQELNYFTKALGRPITTEEAKSLGIHLRALERLLNKSLLDQTLTDLQISTGDRFLLKTLKNDPNFQDSKGDFSRKNYQLYLDRLSLNESQFEDILRTDMTRNFLLQALGGNFSVNKNISNLMVDYAGEKRMISLYKAKDSIVNVPKALEEKSLQDFFEKAKENYRTPDIKKVSILRLDPIRLADNMSIPEQDILETFNLRKRDYQRPERKKINRLIFTDEQEALAQIAKIRSGDQTFEGIALERNLSSDDLLLGTFSKNEMDLKTSDLIFQKELQVGSVVGPILGELGYEIYEIKKIYPSEKLTLNNLRDRIRNELAEVKTQEIVSAMIPEIEDMIAAGDSMEAISREFSVQIETIDWSENVNLPHPFNDQKFSALINAATEETSDLVELNSGILVAIRLDEQIKSRIPELSAVRDQVASDLYKSKKLTALEKAVNQILPRTQKSEPLEPTIFDHLFVERVTRQSKIEYLPLGLLKEIFSGNLGDLIITPVSKGSNPYIVVLRIEKIISASNDDLRYKELQDTLQNQMTEQVNNDIILSAINSLKTVYKPSVNSKIVDQIVTNLQ